MLKLYVQPINKLIKLLIKNNLSNKVEVIRRIHDGLQVKFIDGSDVVIHWFSYGHEKGLLESYKMPQDCGDVTGYLTPEKVVERLKINFKQ